MKNFIEKNKAKLMAWMEKSNLPLISNPKLIKMVDHLVTMNFIRYLIIGFTTLGLDFAFYYLLDKTTHWENIYINMSSTLLSLGFNFYMSNFWTFKAGKKSKMKKMGKYASLALFNYFFTNFFFFIVNVVFGISAIITKLVATAIIVSWNYFLYKLWIFKSEE